MTSKRNSLPSLTMNKFFVSKRASMFEICEEDPREKRERSPCGVLDVSERKLKARKENEKKAAMERRKKRQADPYAEESTELEDADTLDIEKKMCGHSNRSVNFGYVKRCLKQSVLPIGECVHCNTSKPFSDKTTSETYNPVIWLCAYCGYQGCDRNSGEKHAFRHYKTPHSDPHCIVINTQYFTVWCYECDSEVVDKSSKKLHEVINYVKRLSEKAPKKSLVSQLTVAKPSTNLTTQYSGSDSRLYTRKSYEDIEKSSKTQKHYQASINNASLPKVKGISNLGNTCFFNSVLQNLAQTHFLTQTLDIQLQSGQRISLPGSLPEDYKKLLEKKNDANSEEDEENEIVELKPMDVFLPEGGALSLALGVYLRDMQSAKKNGAINPGHLFGQICKKRVQFQGNQQQDAHELLRCLLDAIRTEEILRTERAILKAFALNEKTDVNNINSRLRKTIKGYGKQGTHTIIDQIFGGQLISTVICEECQWSSQVFEPFMDLSLPVNEEKGKPRNWNYSSEDVNQSSHSLHGTDSLRKHAMKNHRKEEKRRNRKNKPQGTRSTGATSNSSCPILIKEESSEKENKKARRTTEKRRPEDEEEFRLKEEQERKALEERKKKGGKRKGESSKFKLLMEARNAARREERGSELEEEESDEELEYDHDDDEEDDSLYTLKKNKKNEEKELEEDEEEEVEEEEVEEEEEEEEEVEEEEVEEEETEETETTETESEVANNVKSKSKNVSRETSDADVEDNTDSEHDRIVFSNTTRHPSIVVDEFATDPYSTQESTEIDNRYLRTSNSFDQLNYSSDCSERYYTAAGPDTNDELDNVTADRASCNTTSGKGDSISISSGTFEESRYNPRVIIDSGQIDDVGFKMGELKIRHISSSKESLLDSHHKGFKKDSHENLFNNTERLNEDWTQHKKSILKKLKQDWIARSLTTLIPRYHSERQECSVMSCLSNFMSPELLTGQNKVSCENCKKRLQSEGVKSNASKQLLILSPPAVLTLHLKRFSHAGVRLTKVNRFVQFPLVLDIAAFTSSMSLGLSNMSKGQTQVLYGLYGIVEHSGRLDSGHYVAYVRVRSVDSSRTSKQMLNIKPWNQFDINHMVTDLASKNEPEKCSLNGGFRFHHLPFHPLNPESVEEEIKTGRWFFVSDTYVNEVNIEKVLKAQAYLLFYERII